MKVREVCEAVKSDAISLNVCGHSVTCPKDLFLLHYHNLIEIENGANDNKWCQSKDEPKEITNKNMRDHYKWKLDREADPELPIYSLQQFNCDRCGKTLQWALVNNELQLRNQNFEDKTEFCPFAEIRPTTGEISVTSPLIFVNFLEEFEDAPEGKEYTPEYSLNNFAGRKAITKHKAKQNVAYGQLTNTTIGIYINKTKDSIIIGPNYSPDEEEEELEEYQQAFKGYKKVGSITLDVWRFEATDLTTLLSKITNYKEFVKDNKDRGIVSLKVPHGTWKFEHYFDAIYRDDEELNQRKYNKYIYTKLNLKKI